MKWKTIIKRGKADPVRFLERELMYTEDKKYARESDVGDGR